MRNRALLAGAASIALMIASISANADDWYIGVNDGTCVSAKMITAATSGFGWASPYILAEALRAVGTHVDLETTKVNQSLMVFVKIGAVPNEPSLDHANFVYFNDKETCLSMERKVHR